MHYTTIHDLNRKRRMASQLAKKKYRESKAKKETVTDAIATLLAQPSPSPLPHLPYDIGDLQRVVVSYQTSEKLDIYMEDVTRDVDAGIVRFGLHHPLKSTAHQMVDQLQGVHLDTIDTFAFWFDMGLDSESVFDHMNKIMAHFVTVYDLHLKTILCDCFQYKADFIKSHEEGHALILQQMKFLMLDKYKSCRVVILNPFAELGELSFVVLKTPTFST